MIAQLRVNLADRLAEYFTRGVASLVCATNPAMRGAEPVIPRQRGICVMRRTRIVIVLALLWGADVAGTWLLPDRDQVVLNGAAIAISFAVLGRWMERRRQEGTRAVIFEAAKREAALIKTIERLTGVPQTGPMAALRDRRAA